MGAKSAARQRWLLLWLWLCAAAFSLPAVAQIDRIEERPAESGLRETEQASGAARRPGGVITGIEFEAILARPDDADLNYSYALQAIRLGDLLSAAAALERILLLQPELDAVRLLYAVVLFRLDSLQEAEENFRIVRGRTGNPALQAEIDGYMAQLGRRQRATRFTLSLSAGIDYNTNRSAAPKSKMSLFADTPVVVEGAQDDIGRIGVAGLQVRHDLGFQERHELLANMSFYYNNQVEIDTQDLAALNLEVGGVYRTRWLDFSASFLYNRVSLHADKYLEGPGGKVLLERRFTTLDLYGSFTAQHQEFFASNSYPTEDYRDGLRIDLEAGLNYAVTPDHRLGVNYIHTIKEARNHHQAYYADEISLTHTWLLGQGQFLVSGFTFADTRYVDPDGFVSSRRRHDRSYRLRAIYGVPLGTLAKFADMVLPEAVGGIVVSLLAEGYRADSNIPNYEYDNFRTQLLFTKRFDW